MRSYFQDQRGNAKRRGIRWELTYSQWLGLWMASGKIKLRGRKWDEFCMARPGDAGPYSIDNVIIISNADNYRMRRPRIGVVPYSPEKRERCRLLMAAHRRRKKAGVQNLEAKAL
jgi:hypothetical protein